MDQNTDGTILKAFKTELRATPAQAEMFELCCEARRVTYNWALLRYRDAYEYVSEIVESALGRFDTDASAMDVLLKYTFIGSDKPPSKKSRAENDVRGKRDNAEIEIDRAWSAIQDVDPAVIARRKVVIAEFAVSWRKYLNDSEVWKALPDEEKRTMRRPKKPSLKLRLFQLPNGDDVFSFLKKQWRRVYRSSWEMQWMEFVPSSVIDGAFTDLASAYSNWMNYLKLTPAEQMSRPTMGYPKPKKRQNNSSFSVIRSPGGLMVERDSVSIPNIGVVGLKEKDYIPVGRTKSKVTISSAGGRWFVSVLGAFKPWVLPKDRPIAGIDVGIVHYAIIKPEGEPIERVENPRHLMHGQKRLKMLQRNMSRKMGPMVYSVTMPDGSVKTFPTNHIEVRRARADGRHTARAFQAPSHRWEKCRQKVNVCHYRISCRRKNFLHELTTQMVRRFGAVSVETLGIQDMIRRKGKKSTNKLLRMAIGDASWYEFRRQLTYKGLWYGTTIEAVNRWYPSTQECSVCKTTTEVNWHDRKCRCPKCNLVIDMDDNAAVNMLAEMIRKAAG